MSWGAGYITQIDYIHGYFRELGAEHLRFACLAAGVVPPKLDRVSYLELGFGQGISLNIHACATPGTFWGNDFNPAQTASARTLADAAGSGAVLVEDSFAELAARPDLPEFDFIVMHGIWSWISEENRRVIIDIVRRKLRPGGVLYVSYNASPGWLAASPLHQLFMLHAQFVSPEALGVTERTKRALEFAARIRDAGALYFKSNPAAADALSKMLEKDPVYVAHEFFNAHWYPMTVTQVASDLESAKLAFATPVVLREQIEGFGLSADAKALIAETDSPVFQQVLRDYFHNRQFRRDLFVKGIRRLSDQEQIAQLMAQPIVLIVHPDDIPAEIPGASLMVQDGAPPQAVIAALAEDAFRPKTIAELMNHPELKSMGLRRLLNHIRLLNGPGFAAPALAQPAKDAARYCAALNLHFFETSQYRGEDTFLASPVVGGGVFASQISQLFLLAAKRGIKTPAEQAKFLRSTPALARGSITRQGKKLETDEEIMSDLVRRAGEFADKRLRLLTALGVA